MESVWSEYELLDFGSSRKLERFGQWVLDRPAPAAAAMQRRESWEKALARFQGDRAADGKWLPPVTKWDTADIVMAVGDLGFLMKLSPLPSGQIGIFPEQWDNWRWLNRQVSRAEKPLKLLNLFAYTGGSTLAAAAAGAEVTHIDAAKSMVARARENAELSGLAEAPIRWIVEDAKKFCEREVKRGNQYDGVILDPPTYGHGPKGEEWSINRDLLPLLQLCGELTAEGRCLLLCTCHSPGIGPSELSAYLCEGIFGHCGQPPASGNLFLRTTDGRKLPSGVFARWPAKP